MRNQSTKFRTKSWVEINDESRGTYNNASQIRFKLSMLKSSLFDYSQADIIAKETITISNTAAQDKVNGGNNKRCAKKNCLKTVLHLLAA